MARLLSLFALIAVAGYFTGTSAFGVNNSNNHAHPQVELLPQPLAIPTRRGFLAAAAASAAVAVAPRESVAIDIGGKIQLGDESIMRPKEHGTSIKPVQTDLLYGVSRSLADKICNYNR
jgi:hypothetical protein